MSRTPSQFQPGELYTRNQIHEVLGGQRQGGISTPSKYPVILLFSSESGRQFGCKDEWKDDGFFHYVGEGQRGDMQLTRGNRAIAEHGRSGKTLMLFVGHPSGRYRFVGPMDYVEHYWTTLPDVDGHSRKAVVFKLTPARLPMTDQVTPAADEGLSFLASRPAAIEAARGSHGAEGRASSYRERSAKVARYVLERADGSCECCGQPAPFTRADGSPYLEAHWVLRASDNGPDEPRYVAALCPTCHRRIHHGGDGEALNTRLGATLSTVERAIENGRMRVVTAAIIANRDGDVFVTQRAAGALAGCWEFPGGKVDPGESLAECLTREIREELSLAIENPRPFLMVDHDYPDFHERLFTFICSVSGAPRLNEHSAGLWVGVSDLGGLPLAAADRVVAEHLQRLGLR